MDKGREANGARPRAREKGRPRAKEDRPKRQKEGVGRGF